jgi:hypothetical protein
MAVIVVVVVTVEEPLTLLTASRGRPSQPGTDTGIKFGNSYDTVFNVL